MSDKPASAREWWFDTEVNSDGVEDVIALHHSKPEYEPDFHVVEISALTEAKSEIETWQARAEINGKKAFEWQDKCEARDAEIAQLNNYSGIQERIADEFQPFIGDVATTRASIVAANERIKSLEEEVERLKNGG
jgi:hypothetical protein